jgi:hypothetical protein
MRTTRARERNEFVSFVFLRYAHYARQHPTLSGAIRLRSHDFAKLILLLRGRFQVIEIELIYLV